MMYMFRYVGKSTTVHNCEQTFYFAFNLSPGQTDRQVVASGRKLNLRRNLRWVVKRTRKFPRKFTQVANKNILRQSILYFIG